MKHTEKNVAAGDDVRPLRISEIFYSLQGEARTQGYPTVFIRLTGCPLRCQYCDTSYAFSGGENMSLAAVMVDVQKHPTPYITVTGGEPLAQRSCIPLLTQLCDVGYQVSLETSGAMDISAVDARVSRVMDLKTPDSGELEKNRYDNIALLTAHDQLKFVICSRGDYDWAKKMIEQYDLCKRCEVLMTPSQHQVKARDIADWVLADGLLVRVQMQLHKQLWGDVAGK